MNNSRGVQHGTTVEEQPRKLRELVKEIIEEVKEFTATRLEVMKSELHATVAVAKVAIPIALVAAVFLFSGFLLLSAAAVVIVARGFAGSPLAWFFAFLIVGIVWLAVGAVFAFFAFNQFRRKAHFPKRTMEVLKADRAWLQSEASQAGVIR